MTYIMGDEEATGASGDMPAAHGEPVLDSVTRQAPWWLVSVVFHVLLIVLAYMFSIAVDLDTHEEALITVIPIVSRPQEVKEEKSQIIQTSSSVLSGEHNVDPTDPNSKVKSEIFVPDDIKAKAILGDHWVTINPDVPDTDSALGTPDALSFHLVSGSAAAPGSGGTNGMNDMQEMIGAGSASTRGRNGGWGGGDQGGVGKVPGIGNGSFALRLRGGGRRLMIPGTGVSKLTEDAVDAALRWLAYHQETDGHWDAKKYGASEKTDTAVTGLALLTFLGTGYSERLGEYKDNVKRAVAWLKSKQAANGLVWDTTDAGGHRGEGYPGAIATMALAEAAAMGNVPATRDAAQKAVNYFTEIHQSGEGSDKGAWRYHEKMEADTSVTGWVIMALKSAKIAGLHVNLASFDGAIKYLDSVEHKAAGGDPGYAPASTYWYMVKEAHEPQRLTAIGSLCRQFLGWKKEDLQATVDGFIAKGGVPVWGGNGGSVDLYYWYYGTFCTFQQGGATWEKWNDALKTALVPNQRKEGDEAGSWDPVGAYSGEWGRVGETALGALCLEVYYRFKRMGE